MTNGILNFHYMNEYDALEQQAIDSAINLDWKQAIITNKKILKEAKHDLNCLLRLAFAYMQSRDFLNAKKTYRQVIKIQSENQIAHEHLERIEILEKEGTTGPVMRANKFDPNLFLEIPGKTRTATLLNPGQKNILAQLTVGVQVLIKPKKVRAEIRTTLNEYVGVLPDDLSKRLSLFIKAGSEYSCFIKEVSITKVVIFIREDKKGKKVAKFSSFPKNVQSNMGRMGTEDDGKVGHEDDEDASGDAISDNELERLAESLNHEDKDFFTFAREEDEDKDEE